MEVTTNAKFTCGLPYQLHAGKIFYVLEFIWCGYTFVFRDNILFGPAKYTAHHDMSSTNATNELRATVMSAWNCHHYWDKTNTRAQR